jgi:hypothetical protein
VRLVEMSDRGARADPGRKRRLRQWLAIADVPLDQYGGAAIDAQLSNLDWVARAAVAHEAVVESFGSAPAVLPMKLFTMYASDERALDDLARKHERIATLIDRVANHREWGVRVQLDRVPATSSRTQTSRGRPAISGTSYLTQKKAQKQARLELALHASEVVADLYEALSACATDARRRGARDLTPEGSLLLDAAFLIPERRTTRFQRAVERHARVLARNGYQLRLTGPWPAYSFMQD